MAFALGYAAAIVSYLMIGAGLGVYIIATNSARFFAAGWQYRSMIRCVMLTSFLWPTALYSGPE